MLKNTAGQTIGAQMVSATDGSAFTGTVTAFITGDGGTQASLGSCVHEGNGYHSYALSQANTNFDHIAFTFTGTGAIPATVQVFTNVGLATASALATVDANVDAIFVDTGSTIPAQISGLNDFNPATDTVASVTTVTNMRGTDNAMLASSYTAPDNASITAILADTNELQLNQGNWLTSTGFSTFNPAVDVVANVTLVDTVTTNTDMVAAPDNASIEAIKAKTDSLPDNMQSDIDDIKSNTNLIPATI